MKELYFAYGSNLNVGQMAVRCPMAQLVCRAVLEGYELAFRRGVLTILPKAGGRIDGILWKVNDRDERALDRYEGYPHLYTKESLTVQTDTGSQTAVAYVMTTPYCEKAQPPSPGGDLPGPHIGGEDDDRVAEVGPPALGVGEHPVL